ncbi:MAG: General secretion pathway protein M [Syntrophorhabdus sp. PtaU1.Bin058]|nr:MAG: General secretion pathway protein M [Syntrophorhabdus sp. PtaU1.Bin058]
MGTLKNRTLTFLILLMAALLIAVAYRYGYLAVKAGIASVREERAIRIKTFQKQMALIAQKPAMQKKLDLLIETRKADNSKLFDGKTSSISTAALLETVKGIITGRGGTILSERAGKPGALGRLTVIAASIDASLPDARTLGDILYAMETRTPYLVVKEIDIRVKALNEPKALSVKLEITALSGEKK